jgi:DNA-directed RNA polymerase subunit L
MFSVESIGFYEPKTVFLLGIESLIEKLSMIHLEFNNKKSKKVIIKYDEENEDFFNFLIDEENETIGNLLSTYITYNDNVFFSGYLIEHPLKKNIILKIKLNKDNTLDNVISIITINIDKIINILKNIIVELQ